jgi:hypothetical protein
VLQAAFHEVRHSTSTRVQGADFAARILSTGGARHVFARSTCLFARFDLERARIPDAVLVIRAAFVSTESLVLLPEMLVRNRG